MSGAGYWMDFTRSRQAARDHSNTTELDSRAGIRMGIRIERDPREMSGTFSGDSFLEGLFYVDSSKGFGATLIAWGGTEDDDAWRPYRDTELELDDRYEVDLGPWDEPWPLCDPRVTTVTPNPAPAMVDPASGPYAAQTTSRPLPQGHPSFLLAGSEEASQALHHYGAWAGLIIADQRGDDAPKYGTAYVDVSGDEIDRARVAPVPATWRVVHTLDNECQGAIDLGQPFSGRGWGWGAFVAHGARRDVGLASDGAGGLLHVAGLTDKHRHWLNKDTEAVGPVELSLSAPWHANDEFCAPPLHSGPWFPAGASGVPVVTELRYDDDLSHTLPTWDPATKTMVPRVYAGIHRWETWIPQVTLEPPDGVEPPGDGTDPPGSGTGDPPGGGGDGTETGGPINSDPGGGPITFTPEDEGAGPVTLEPIDQPGGSVTLGEADLDYLRVRSTYDLFPRAAAELVGVPYTPFASGGALASRPTREQALDATARLPAVFAASFLGASSSSGAGGFDRTEESGRNRFGGTSGGRLYIHPPELRLSDFFRGQATASALADFEDVAPQGLSPTGLGLMPERGLIEWGWPIFDGEASGGLSDGFRLAMSSSGDWTLANLDGDGASLAALVVDSAGDVNAANDLSVGSGTNFKATHDASAITDDRTITYPDADVDLGALGAMHLLATATPDGVTTVTLSGLAPYRSYVVKLWLVNDTSGDGFTLSARLNGDTGNNYDYLSRTVDAAGASTSSDDAAAHAQLVDAVGGNGTAYVELTISYDGVAARIVGQASVNASTALDLVTFVARWASGDAISSVTLLTLADGSFAAGSRVEIYGVGAVIPS